MVSRITCSFPQAFYYIWWCGKVRVTYTKADHVDALGQNFLFQAIEFSEKIRRQKI
jgi:hypothetical protein